MAVAIMVGTQAFYFLRFYQASGGHEVREMFDVQILFLSHAKKVYMVVGVVI